MSRKIEAGSPKFIGMEASVALSKLLDLAGSGNVEAAKELHEILHGAVSEFDELCYYSPELFEPIAQKHSTWPGMLTSDADIKRRNAALLEKLHLGRDADLNYSGKPWTRDTPGTFVALQLYGMVKVWREGWLRRGEQRQRMREFNKAHGRPANYKPERKSPEMSDATAIEFKLYGQSFELAKKLAPLNRNNCKEWFDAAWPAFIARYGEDFENHRRFSGWIPDSISVREQKKPRGVMRREITKRIRQGFKTIARSI